MSEENLRKQSEEVIKEWTAPIRIDGRFNPSEPVRFAQGDTTHRYFVVTPGPKLYSDEPGYDIFRARMYVRDNRIWWMELSENVTPSGYIFYRKTKGGKWETVIKITDTTNKKFVMGLFNAMLSYEYGKYGNHAAMKVTSLDGRQMFSSYYLKLYEMLSSKFSDDKMFGLSINKGDEYLMFHPTLKKDSIKTISNYFCKLAGKHDGIKFFRAAKLDERDGNLFWGWMTFYDGHKISIAYDADFGLYNQYKNNLQTINISYLKKR